MLIPMCVHCSLAAGWQERLQNDAFCIEWKEGRKNPANRRRSFSQEVGTGGSNWYRWQRTRGVGWLVGERCHARAGRSVSASVCGAVRRFILYLADSVYDTLWHLAAAAAARTSLSLSLCRHPRCTVTRCGNVECNVPVTHERRASTQIARVAKTSTAEHSPVRWLLCVLGDYDSVTLCRRRRRFQLALTQCCSIATCVPDLFMSCYENYSKNCS